SLPRRDLVQPCLFFRGKRALIAEHAANGCRSGSAATGGAIAEKLLDALASVDFGGVDIALATPAHLMSPVEFARRAAAVAEPPEFFEIASIQNINRHVGVVCDVQAALRLVGGEVHGDGSSDDVGVIADKALGDE